MEFVKSLEFLDVLKIAKCVTLPVNIDSLSNCSWVGYELSFLAKDSLFFAKAFKNKKIDTINRLARNDWIDADGVKLNNYVDSTSYDFYRADVKAHPLAIIFSNKNFILVCILNQLSNQSCQSLLCTFNNNGGYIDGFVATAGDGKSHGGCYRNTKIKDGLIIEISESSWTSGGEGDFEFQSLYKISEQGKFVILKTKIKYGKNYVKEW